MAVAVRWIGGRSLVLAAAVTVALCAGSASPLAMRIQMQGDAAGPPVAAPPIDSWSPTYHAPLPRDMPPAGLDPWAPGYSETLRAQCLARDSATLAAIRCQIDLTFDEVRAITETTSVAEPRPTFVLDRAAIRAADRLGVGRDHGASPPLLRGPDGSLF